MSNTQLKELRNTFPELEESEAKEIDYNIKEEIRKKIRDYKPSQQDIAKFICDRVEYSTGRHPHGKSEEDVNNLAGIYLDNKRICDLQESWSGFID